jgi:sulfite reductase beta subunit-like hemoprotein
MNDIAAVKLTHNEEIKAAIPTIAGTIAATISDENADHFTHDDYEFLKFHGVYQQDDRDLRKTGKKYIHDDERHLRLAQGRGREMVPDVVRPNGARQRH